MHEEGKDNLKTFELELPVTIGQIGLSMLKDQT